MTKLTFPELLDLVKGALERADMQAKWEQPGVTGMVIFENQQMDSSNFGDRTGMIVGPGCTYKSAAECEGKHLFDLPSYRQYAKYYAEKCLKDEPTG